MSSLIIAPLLAGTVLGSAASSFVIAEWKDAGGPPGPPRWIAPLHLHRNDDEAWYVLEGTLCVRVGKEIVEARAGAAVLVPRGTAHTYWNPTPQLCRYLLVMSPNIYSLIQDIHAMKERIPGAMDAVFAKHDSELVRE
ncbi:MAG: cupin domain-containing protein [Candidatus Sulfotelmatobacter sp.]